MVNIIIVLCMTVLSALAVNMAVMTMHQWWVSSERYQRRLSGVVNHPRWSADSEKLVSAIANNCEKQA